MQINLCVLRGLCGEHNFQEKSHQARAVVAVGLGGWF